jgi:hypothetical protein
LTKPHPSYILFSIKKDCQKFELRIAQSDPKRVIWNFRFDLWIIKFIININVRVYAYILSMVKSCCCVENTHGVFYKHAPRRWTAIAMGEVRTRPISGPLAMTPFLQIASFLYDAPIFVQRASPTLFT